MRTRPENEEAMCSIFRIILHLFVTIVVFTLSNIPSNAFSREKIGPKAFLVIDKVLTGEKPNENDLALVLANLADPQDKLEFQNFVRNWRPPPGMSYDARPWQLDVYEKQKLLYRTSWLSVDPQILSVNGSLLFGHSKDPSFYRRVENLLKDFKTRKNSSRTSIYFERAEAKGNEDTLKTPLFAFLLANALSTADDLVREESYSIALKLFQHRSFPPLTWYERNISGKKIYCTDQGVDAVTYNLDGTKYILRSIGGGDFEVTLPSKNSEKLKIRIAPNTERSSSEQSAQTCASGSFSGSPINEVCLRFWDLYRLANSDFKPTENSRRYGCQGTPQPRACVDFFRAKQIEFDSKNLVYTKTSVPPLDTTAIFKCQDDTCTKSDKLSVANFGKTVLIDAEDIDKKALGQEMPIRARDEYLNVVRSYFSTNVDGLCDTKNANSGSVEIKCKLPDGIAQMKDDSQRRLIHSFHRRTVDPKSQMQLPSEKFGEKLAYEMADKARGLLVLSECCKSERCKSILLKNHGIDLDTKKPSIVK